MLTTFAILVGLLAPNTAKINIDSEPKPSVVEVDGRKVKMRLNTITVKAGRHKITLRRGGYMSQTKVVTAGAGKTTKVKFRLIKPSAAKKPRSKKPAKGFVRRPAAKKPAAKKPATKRPAAKRPAAKKPGKGFAGGRQPAKKPTSKRPVKKPGKKPIRKRPAKKKPAIRHKPKTTVGRKPKVGRKPTARKHPKTKRRPRTAKPRGTAGGVDERAPDRRDSRRSSYKPWAVFFYVVGAVGVTGGVLAGMQANDQADEFNRSTSLRDKQDFKSGADNWALGSNIAYGVGASGILLGSLLWAMDPGDDYRAQLSPMPGGGAYVSVGGTF